MIIAELGMNAYPFTPERLDVMCETAANCGADAVKIQFFRAAHFPASERVGKRQYQFPATRLSEFAEIAHRYELRAGASVFEPRHVEKAELAGMDFIKIASREWRNEKLRLACEMDTSLPIYQSWPAFHLPDEDPGYFQWHCVPNWRLLLCVSQYPTPEALAVQVAAMLESPFKGWSSHTAGWIDCEIAKGRGATIFEKHLALSKSDPEYRWALLPAAFEKMCVGLGDIHE